MIHLDLFTSGGKGYLVVDDRASGLFRVDIMVRNHMVDVILTM